MASTSGLQAQGHQFSHSSSRQRRRQIEVVPACTKLEQALESLPFNLSFNKLLKLVEFQVHSHLKKYQFINNGLTHYQLKQDVVNEMIAYFCTEKGLEYIKNAYTQSYIQQVIRSRSSDFLKSLSRYSKHEIPLVCFKASNDDQKDRFYEDKLSYLSHNDDVDLQTDVSVNYETRKSIERQSKQLILGLESLPKLRRSAFIIQYWDEIVLICQSLRSELYDINKILELIHIKSRSSQDFLVLMNRYTNSQDRLEHILKETQIYTDEKMKRAKNAHAQNLARAKRSLKALIKSAHALA